MEVINVDGTLINHVKDSPEIYLNKSVILFGQSGTGKTVLVKHILNILKEQVPNCIAFVPTDDEEDKDSYSKIINPRCVIRNMDMALIKMRNLFIRQTEGRKISSLIKDLNKLRSMYEKNRIDKIDLIISKTVQATKEAKEKIKASDAYSQDQKDNQITEINKMLEERLREYYKQGIEKYKQSLFENHKNGSHKLTEEEIMLLTYLRYNNNIIIIYDDCMAEIAKWGKDEEIKKIFFQGRHYNITTMFVMHSDKGFPPDLRQNAFINIFTMPAVANNYFSTKNNGISKELGKKMPKIIERVFREPVDPKAPKNYKKLVFIPRDSNQIQYIVAKIIPNFTFGCDTLRMLTDRLDEIEKEKNKNNKKRSAFNSFL